MATITLELFAPYNKAATVMGDFTDWEPVEMKKHEDGFFRHNVELDDGDYRYKFRVQSQSWFYDADEWIDITDPQATEIDHSAEENAVLRVQRGERILDDYTWQHDDTTLVPDHQLIIYELHVADFSSSDDSKHGRFSDVIDKLDYLSELGINAIELMPLAAFPGSYSWGYNPRHFFAPAPSYGTPKDLKKLVDACHAHGIRVMLDAVYNHAENETPLTQINHDYWFYHEPQDETNSWGPEFNYAHYDNNLNLYPARHFAGSAIAHWVSTYHLDGLRFDAAKQLDNYDFMHSAVGQAKDLAAAKPFYAIAERLPETPNITGQNGPMDACWHENFYETIKMALIEDRLDLGAIKDAIDGQRRGFAAATNLINYLSNHDHHQFMAELAEAGIFADEAFQRLKLGAAILFTAVGVPLIWMGEEFGDHRKKSTEPSKMNWALQTTQANQELLASIKGLIALRKELAALQGNNIHFFFEDNSNSVLAYVRWHDDASKVATVINFGSNFVADYQIDNFPADGLWHEWLADYDVEAHEGFLSLDLGPREAKVFVQHH